MKKTILFIVTALLAFTNIASAQLVFDGGPSGTGTDFFDEANWVDTETGMDPEPDTVNPVEITNGLFSGGFITSDLTIGGEFAVVAEGVGDDVANIRMTNGLTLTLEDNATLNCQLLTANDGEEINVVLSDNAELTVERIARTAFDVSGAANVTFTGVAPEFENDTINLSLDWTGTITTELPNGNRQDFIGPNGSALFNSATIDGVAATSIDFSSVFFGADIFHSIPLRGDVNRDGVIDFLDITTFVMLLNFSPNGFRAEADIHVDGVVNFLDIMPFVDVLTGA